MFSFDLFQKNKLNFPAIYLGVVEDDKDPDKAGKVKVRILGIHSDKRKTSETDGIAVEDLPWAIPALPNFEGGTSGLGIFSVPVKGSWVAIFFVGGDHNYPIYFANIAAIPKEKPDKSLGFSDPDGKYPIITGEPDWNRNARNSGELIKDTKNDKREQGISQFKGESWDEPESPYEAEYPSNTVITTRDNGTTIELDSTQGAERFHIYHKASGNYLEIGPEGQTVYKSNADNFEINITNKNILVKENCNVHIGEDFDTLIEGDYTKSVTGKKEQDIDGNVILNIGGAENKFIGENKELKVDGDSSEIIDGNVTKTIDGDTKETIGGKLTITVTGDVEIKTSGKCNIESTGKCSVKANKIDLDGGGGAMCKAVHSMGMCMFTGSPLEATGASQTIKVSL